MLVSVDLGYGWVKAIREDGRRLAFPAVLAPAPRSLGFAEAGSSNGERYRLAVGSEQVLVGEAAVVAGGSRGLADVASHRPGLRTLLLAALGLLCGDVSGPLDALLGLPVAAYARADERSELLALFGGLGETVNDRPLRIGRVDLYPQGAGAFFAAAQRDSGLRSGVTGVVDVGHWTTDYMILSTERGVQVREGAWGSIPAGMADVIRALCRALEGRLRRSPEPLRVEMAVRDGRPYRHQGQAIPLHDLLEPATRELARRIEAALQDAWRRELPALDRVVLAGGGASAVAPALGTLHARIVSAPEGQWANAEGYLVLRGAKRGSGVA